MSKRIYILGVLLLLVAGVTSCRYNEMEPEDNASAGAKPGQKSGKLEFVLGTAKSVSTKSDAPVKSEGVKAFLCEEGNDSLFLVSSVTENRDNVFKHAAVPTKGAPVTAENLTDFYVSAYISPQLKYFDYVHVGQEDMSVVEDVTLYTLDYYWPSDDTDLDFYATNFNKIEDQQNTLTFGYSEDDCLGSFRYSLPEPDLANKNDAKNQPDYVFAITPDQVKSVYPVPLNFAHCFSAITFRIGAAYMDPDGRQVKEVKISGVPSSGVCTFARDIEGAMNFSWNTVGAYLKTYTQAIPYEGTQTNIQNNQIINDGQMTFMLIPHEIDDDAKISITIAMHNELEPEHQHEIVIEKPIKELFAADAPKCWEAGKKYIYTIASEEKVDLEVTDKFVSTEPMIKGNLEIKNESNVPVYVRAYIVGWWENEAGVIVAPWTQADGRFVGQGWTDGMNFDGSGSGWRLGSDGFFYSIDPVDPGENAPELFKTYTLNNKRSGSKLILNVLSQAVVHHLAPEVWPEAFSDLASVSIME